MIYMTDKKNRQTITLEAIDPVEIFGAGNRILEALCSYFPELKVTARGTEIMLEGKQDDIDLFSRKLDMLIERRTHKMNLTPYDVEEIFDGDSPNERIRLVRAYFENDLIFAVGPAGTGKTYIAIALAVRALKNREIRRIILTRPAVEAGERLGFLPGDLKDKLDPYLQPLYDALGDMIPPRRLQEFMADGIIQIAPLAYMRGRTLDKACVILDEAQNTNLNQLKMFLTRMGCDAKFIVTGDASQVDLPHKEDSGLLKGIELTKDIKGVSAIFFKKEDIVRHPLVSKIVHAFEGQ